MKLKELNKGDDFVRADARKGSIIMRVKSHLKGLETKVSILAYGTTGYVLSDIQDVAGMTFNEALKKIAKK